MYIYSIKKYYRQCFLFSSVVIDDYQQGETCAETSSLLAPFVHVCLCSCLIIFQLFLFMHRGHYDKKKKKKVIRKWTVITDKTK